MDKAYYDHYWEDETIDPSFDPTTAARKRKLATLLEKKTPGTALDLGCGRGTFTDFLGSLGFDVMGVDISQRAIAQATIRYPCWKFQTLNGDGTIPVEGATMDVVWSSEVLEHVFDIHAHLLEVHRVLKDDGLYILTTPYHGVVKNVIVSMLKFSNHFDPEGPHIRFFDKRGLHRCLKRAGFEPILWSGIGRFPLLWRTWFVICRKPLDVHRNKRGAPVSRVMKQCQYPF